jgi:hypothetical protein
MNCIVPLAGPDFFSPVYGLKPLHDVDGEPLLLRALKSRAWYRSGRLRDESLVFVLRRIPEAEQFALQLTAWFPGSRTVWLSDLSQGALLSALAGSALVARPTAPVVVDLADVLFDCAAQAFDRCRTHGTKGALPWFESSDPAFSYAEIASDGVSVLRTAEKKVISRHASAGVYGFADLPTWLEAAAYGIANADRLAVSGIQFVCPAMNGIVENGGKVEAFEVSNARPISKMFKHHSKGAANA